MPRPRSFDESAALLAIQDLFWRQGYELTSYGDLTAATGLGKGSLYAAFGDKRALYLKAMEAYIAHDVGEIVAILTAEAVSPAARIAGFLAMPVEAVEVRGDRRGCFLCNAALDIASANAETQAVVVKALATLMAAVASNLAAIPQTDARAEGIVAAHVGIRVLARGGASVDTLRAARDTALLMLRPGPPASP